VSEENWELLWVYFGRQSWEYLQLIRRPEVFAAQVLRNNGGDEQIFKRPLMSRLVRNKVRAKALGVLSFSRPWFDWREILGITGNGSTPVGPAIPRGAILGFRIEIPQSHFRQILAGC
jgi:hypothetical protein